MIHTVYCKGTYIIHTVDNSIHAVSCIVSCSGLQILCQYIYYFMPIEAVGHANNSVRLIRVSVWGRYFQYRYRTDTEKVSFLISSLHTDSCSSIIAGRCIESDVKRVILSTFSLSCLLVSVVSVSAAWAVSSEH